MDPNRIRNFRKTLRRFDRLNEILNSNCCTGVTLAQCHVLLEIEENTEITTKQLAENFILTKSTLSRTVEKLSRMGLVARKVHPVDRRYTILSLTDNGLKKCNEINKANDQIYEQIFRTISSENPETIIRHFEVLIQAMNKVGQLSLNKKTCCP